MDRFSPKRTAQGDGMSTATQLSSERFQLTPGEKQICAHDQVGQLAPYGIQTLFLSFDTSWPIDQLRDAAQVLIQNYPVFSARLHRVAGGDFRRSQSTTNRITVNELPPAEFQTALASPAFELNGGPGIRVGLTTDGTRHHLGFTLHPAFGDSGVLAEIEQGFVALLDGKALMPGKLVQALSRQSDSQRDRLDYWRAKLNDESCFNARLPRRHGGTEGLDRGLTTQILTPGTTDRLRQLKTPLEVTLLTALGLVLSRYCGHSSLRFGLGQTENTSSRRSEDILPLCLDLPLRHKEKSS